MVERERPHKKTKLSAWPLYVDGLKSMMETQGLTLYEAHRLQLDYYRRYDKSHIKQHMRAVRVLRDKGFRYETHSMEGKVLYELPVYAEYLKAATENRRATTIEEAYQMVRSAFVSKGLNYNDKELRLLRETTLCLIAQRDNYPNFHLVEFTIMGVGKSKAIFIKDSKERPFGFHNWAKEKLKVNN